MKKILSGLMALLAIGLIFYGCSATAVYKKTEKAAAAEPTGTALWNYLAQQDYTKNWKMWPGKTAFYKGTEPHGVLLTTYVNDVAYETIKGRKGMLADRMKKALADLVISCSGQGPTSACPILDALESLDEE